MTKSRTLGALHGVGLAIAAVVLAVTGCDKATSTFVPNMLPTVRLTAAPIDTSGRYFYSYTVNWVGYDPDGRVDHYLYTIDPQTLKPGEDTVWVRTDNNEQTLYFRSTQPVKEPGGRLIGVDQHIFLIKAVDNRGGAGPYSDREFFSYTVAPTIRVTNPAPSSYPSFVTPAVRVSWNGQDDDGVFTQKPVKYKYILLTNSSEFPRDLAIGNPDSLRRYYANHPKGPWAGWDSTSAETTQVQYTNLNPGSQYLFVVIAFDEAGAYSPLFSFDTNMLRLNVGFAGTSGPKLTMFNEFFNYTYSAGQYCPTCAPITVEVPGHQPITMNWSAQAPEGADIKQYRWALDISNVFDNTGRGDDELTDFSHWSTPSSVQSAVIPAPGQVFSGGETHFFYIEAEDNNQLKSLGIVRLQPVDAIFDKPLLVVDDTRLKVDVIRPGQTCQTPPSSPWPSRAEMDTFMFARGGYPWRCYPTGTQSLPGIMNGYKFDTLGTRIGKNDLTFHLSTLSHYTHLMWLVDGAGAVNNRPGTDLTDPSTALRYMGGPGKVNTLGAYVKQGGKVWLSGGGAGYAVSDGFNDRNNDHPTITFSSITSTRNELGPGRFMYDVAKWQSEFRIYKPTVTITKSTGRFRVDPSAYTGLPQLLELKNPDTDPLATEAPLRSPNAFYQRDIDVEFLQVPNYITEDFDPSPIGEDIESSLDTLYKVTAPTLPGSADDTIPGSPLYPLMTYYHGPPPINQTFIMTGFPLWSFQRAEVQQLVDYVLQNIWQLPKNGSLASYSRPAASMASPRAVAPAGPKAGVRAQPLGVRPGRLKLPQD